MMPGVIGNAYFAEDDKRHRLWLERDGIMPEQYGEAYSLFIGMNPSKAMYKLDDPTVRQDQMFTKKFGLSRMFKVNVASWRDTDSSSLSVLTYTQMNHVRNMPTIRDLAANAALIVVCTGELRSVAAECARDTFIALQRDGRELMCLGNVGRWPRHSSRLAHVTPLRNFEWRD
jgi:hypothetical protein